MSSGRYFCSRAVPLAESARRFVEAVEHGEDPEPDDLEEIAEELRAALDHPKHPWRPLLGLTSKRGRPQGPIRPEIVWFVELAHLYGHTRSKAYDLAAEAFGFKESRSVERLVAGTAKLDGPAHRVWERLLTEAGAPLPQKPDPRPSRGRRRPTPSPRRRGA
jgi:hypothetical protein